MRLSLPLKIFLAHAVVLIAIGAVGTWMVRQALTDYGDQWRADVQTLVEEKVSGHVLAEMARSTLLRLEQTLPETRETVRTNISEGLRAALRDVDSIASVVIVDSDHKIQYSNDPEALELTYLGSVNRSRLATDVAARIPLEDGSGATDLVIPVFDYEGGDSPSPRRRLGTMIVRYRPDPTLRARVEDFRLPEPPNVEAFTWPLIIFLAGGLLLGIFVAALTGLPVRRVEKALAEFRSRDFRGGLDPKAVGGAGQLAPAMRAIQELGGRLEALDARGREREALLATLSHSLEQGMVALGADDQPIAWNAAALRLLDVDPDGGLDEGAALREVLLHNEGGLNVDENSPAVQVELTVRNGQRVPVRLTRVPFEVRPGEPGALLLFGDLDTLRKVETHLLEAGRFAVLAHLAAGLAHEIRNPLHSIRINASVVEQYVERSSVAGNQAVAESLETIQSETSRLADLLNNYLGMVRPEREGTLVDLHDLCQRVMQLVDYPARKSHVSMHLDRVGETPMVVGIPDRLQQAILNLVLNAIQAMPDGGDLSLQTGRDNGKVRLKVTDTGPGIPEDLVDRLFETGVTGRAEGSGLGLALVRLIAESHGGSVRHETVAGGGASFVMELPTAPAE